MNYYSFCSLCAAVQGAACSTQGSRNKQALDQHSEVCILQELTLSSLSKDSLFFPSFHSFLSMLPKPVMSTPFLTPLITCILQRLNPKGHRGGGEATSGSGSQLLSLLTRYGCGVWSLRWTDLCLSRSTAVLEGLGHVLGMSSCSFRWSVCIVRACNHSSSLRDTISFMVMRNYAVAGYTYYNTF